MTTIDQQVEDILSKAKVVTSGVISSDELRVVRIESSCTLLGAHGMRHHVVAVVPSVRDAIQGYLGVADQHYYVTEIKEEPLRPGIIVSAFEDTSEDRYY